jgi:hypothetical protein
MVRTAAARLRLPGRLNPIRPSGQSGDAGLQPDVLRGGFGRNHRADEIGHVAIEVQRSSLPNPTLQNRLAT